MSSEIFINKKLIVRYVVYLLIIATFVARFNELKYILTPDLMATPFLIGYIIALVFLIFRWTKSSINFSLFVVFGDIILNMIFLSQFYKTMDVSEFVVVYQVIINVLLISALYTGYTMELNKKK